MDGACGAYGDRIGVFRDLVGKREGERPLGCAAYNHTAISSNNNNNNNNNISIHGAEYFRS